MQQLYTRQAVAERLRVSTKTLQRWVDARELAEIKIGRRVLFSEEDVTNLIEASRVRKVDAAADLAATK